MSEIENVKNDFLKAGYTEEESSILSEQTIKFKSTINADVTVEDAITYLKQAYNGFKL